MCFLCVQLRSTKTNSFDISVTSTEVTAFCPVTQKMPRFRQKIKELLFKNKLDGQKLGTTCNINNISSHSALEIGAILTQFKKSKNHNLIRHHPTLFLALYAIKEQCREIWKYSEKESFLLNIDFHPSQLWARHLFSSNREYKREFEWNDSWNQLWAPVASTVWIWCWPRRKSSGKCIWPHLFLY